MSVTGTSASYVSGFTEAARTAGAAAPVTKALDGTAEESGGFLDAVKGLLDIVNPLQHIPVVSTFYRKLTGDEMSPMARLAGDTLFGGPIGAALAFANIAAEGATGKDIGGTMIAALDTEKESQQDLKEQNFQASPAPTARRTGSSMAMNGNIPADSSYTASTPPATPGESGSTDRRPSSQDAPAATGRTPVPPELIARQMQDGLDKYAAMMKARTAAPAVDLAG